jgi:capsular exopolysaccharide synthesis family protein
VSHPSGVEPRVSTRPEKETAPDRDRRIPEDGEPAAEDAPLNRIDKQDLADAPELVMLSQPRSIHAERFRRLTTTIVHRHGGSAQVIGVTSGLPGEGKSTVATNLALAFATASNERTLLVDADLRRPRVAQFVRTPPEVGLCDVLAGRAPLDAALLRLDGTQLDVLPGGKRVDDPLELLTSNVARDLVADLRRSYRRIVIDTPPIILFSDADAIGALSDGLVVVVRAGSTPKRALAEQLAAITSARILGVVLNCATASLADRGAYRDSYYYHEYYGEKRRKR